MSWAFGVCQSAEKLKNYSQANLSIKITYLQSNSIKNRIMYYIKIKKTPVSSSESREWNSLDKTALTNDLSDILWCTLQKPSRLSFRVVLIFSAKSMRN